MSTTMQDTTQFTTCINLLTTFGQIIDITGE